MAWIKRRVARVKHTCTRCGGTIDVNDDYVHMRDVSSGQITHEQICTDCWSGPLPPLKTKRYNYRRKFRFAKSDGASAIFRG